MVSRVDTPDPVTQMEAQSLVEAITLEKEAITRDAGLARTEIGSARTELIGERARDPSSSPAEVNVAPTPIDEAGFAARYDVRSLLGEGGMGEVRLAKDRRIGREVALKVVRDGKGTLSDARVRFEREARVQGQLEHPSIVPVYDLGIAPDGSAFFTMKRLRGKTFEEICEALRRSDAEAATQFSRRKLLGAFSNVCLAVAFAHARGVLHRDLKPSNIMLGSYGELYVLDWGLAKIRGTPDVDVEGDGAIETVTPLGEARTVAGAILGTPGYMAPEQTRGEVDALDERTDVYALGAILFELLTLSPLHARDHGVAGLYASTLGGVDASPLRRAPSSDVPPELDAICRRATALAPGDRFATAREMHEAVERYLDGDRDVAHRAELADKHVAAAAAAASELSNGASNAPELRARALRELGSALALEPQHPEAITTLLRLLDAPREMPPEARAEYEAQAAANDLVANRKTYRPYLWNLGLAALLLPLGVRSWPLLLLLFASAGVTAAIGFFSARTPSQGRAQLALLIASSVSCACASVFMGPLVTVPTFAASNTLGFVMLGRRELRRTAVALGVGAVFVPFVLQFAGIIPPSYAFGPNGMTVLPGVTNLPEHATLGLLLAIHAVIVGGLAVVLVRVRDALTRSEQRLFMHAYNLRQLVPDAARAAPPAPASEPSSCLASHVSELRLGAKLGGSSR